MNVNESINRGNNLVIVAFLGAIALGLIGEVFMETDIIDKFDDAFIILFGIIAVIWYFTKDHKFQKSYMPLILIAGAFIVKVLAMAIEMDDPASVGDEIGLLVPLLAILIIHIVMLAKTRKISQKAVST
jgi:hypothetical protein